MIEVSHLTKAYGAFTAVDDLSFKLAPGEILGFLGPNGAGKSTTMKMLTGFLRPSSGQVRICGHDVAEDSIAAQQRIGYLPEGAPAWEEMTPLAFLEFIAEVRGLQGEAGQQADQDTRGELHGMGAPGFERVGAPRGAPARAAFVSSLRAPAPTRRDTPPAPGRRWRGPHRHC